MKLTNLILLVIILLSCTKKITNSQIINNLSPDVISFEYDKKKKAILLEGKLNDSIPLTLFFDTGWSSSSNKILLSDSLEHKIGNSQVSLKVGNIDQILEPYYWKKKYFLFQNYGQNTTFLGWQFFQNKIVEISYRDQYIKLLDSIEDRKGYKCLPLKIGEPDCLLCLGVEIEIYIQGKLIQENLLLDTGCNSPVILNNDMITKYSIDINNVRHVTALNSSAKSYLIEADSIKGGYAMKNEPFALFNASENGKKYPFSGLLGNAFLENFDIMLDLKEYNLYLKPIDQ